MIEFKRIAITDKPIVDLILKNNKYRVCDLCFTNLFCWNNTYDTRIAVQDDTFYVKFTTHKGKHGYLMPQGKDIKSSIELIIEDAKQNDEEFFIAGITNRMWDDIEEAMPNNFDKTSHRDAAEYIYLSENLIHLKGKKLQSKRNHINRFKKENSWRYVSLGTEKEYIEECRSMLKKWKEINEADGDRELGDDFVATNLMLDHFNELGLRGGAILVDEQLVAFSLGTPLNSETFVVHVEKAFTDIHGAYTIINQQFVENEASEFKYINREEDMGMQSLRKAKLSYQPEILLEESILTLKNSSVYK